LEAIAEDRGSNPLSRTVEVEIDVVDRSNKPPVWDQTIYGPIYVKENTAVGVTVTTIKARSALQKVAPQKAIQKKTLAKFFGLIAKIRILNLVCRPGIFGIPRPSMNAQWSHVETIF
jgi:hypothetical protein